MICESEVKMIFQKTKKYVEREKPWVHKILGHDVLNLKESKLKCYTWDGRLWGARCELWQRDRLSGGGLVVRGRPQIIIQPKMKTSCSSWNVYLPGSSPSPIDSQFTIHSEWLVSECNFVLELNDVVFRSHYVLSDLLPKTKCQIRKESIETETRWFLGVACTMHILSNNFHLFIILSDGCGWLWTFAFY